MRAVYLKRSASPHYVVPFRMGGKNSLWTACTKPMVLGDALVMLFCERVRRLRGLLEWFEMYLQCSSAPVQFILHQPLNMMLSSYIYHWVFWQLHSRPTLITSSWQAVGKNLHFGDLESNSDQKSEFCQMLELKSQSGRSQVSLKEGDLPETYDIGNQVESTCCSLVLLFRSLSFCFQSKQCGLFRSCIYNTC